MYMENKVTNVIEIKSRNDGFQKLGRNDKARLQLGGRKTLWGHFTARGPRIVIAYCVSQKARSIFSIFAEIT